VGCTEGCEKRAEVVWEYPKSVQNGPKTGLKRANCSLLAEVRREIDTFGYFDLMAGSKPCCLNIGF
jgi:hypothetical protein